MYHNNKDNSIKTPIIARYNTPRWETDREQREGIFCLFIIILWVSQIYLNMWDFCVNIPCSLCILSTTCDVFAEIFTGLQTLCPRSDQPPNIPRAEAGARPTWPGRMKTFCWSEARRGQSRGEWPLVASSLGNDQVTTCSGERCRQPRYGGTVRENIY